MEQDLKLMCVFAHPDDETLGTGGILAAYFRQGISTHLICATRGERGWGGVPSANPGLQGLGKIRTAELLAAAEVLGIQSVHFLDYIDGDLDQADPLEAAARIAVHLRQVRPQVVVTFPPDGSYGHPDHIAISQYTSAAVVLAADAGFIAPDGSPPHRVSKLYYMTDTKTTIKLYTDLVGEFDFPVDGQKRSFVGWDEWMVTTRIDASAEWETVYRAILCHQTQHPSLGGIEQAPPEFHQALWRQSAFYRVYSLVNGGRQVETDLFAGLR
jgi:LmbE family N-acetylglucosaminyl deacetylase